MQLAPAVVVVATQHLLFRELLLRVLVVAVLALEVLAVAEP